MDEVKEAGTPLVAEEAVPAPAPETTANEDERSLIEKYKASNELVAKYAALVKSAQKDADEAEFKLMSLLEDDGKRATAKYEGLGYVCIVEGAAHASIEKGRQEDVLQQIRDMGREDMIKTSVAPATLSVYVRECLKENKPLPEGVTFYKPKYLKPYLTKN